MIEDVTNTKWYNDPCTNMIFHHLAYKAFFADELVYKQGQCKFSVADLCKVFPFTAKQINLAIEKLRKDGVIETQGTPSGTIFTIIKHLHFASKKEESERANERANERKNENYAQNALNQLITEQKKQERANERENKKTNERANYIDNNIYIDNNNNIYSTTTTIKSDDEKFFCELERTDTEFFSLACMRLNIDMTIYLDLLAVFKSECRLREKYHLSMTDAKEHFVSWSRGELERRKQQIKQQKNYGSNQAKYDQTDSYEPKSTRENYFL